MLYDRDYMRDAEDDWYPGKGPGPSPVSVTMILMVANVVFFLLESFIEYTDGNLRSVLYNLFSLNLNGLKHGYVWQVITFQFMHASLLHLAGNLLVIYFFGKAVERTMTRLGYLVFYLGCGVAGGLLQVLCFLVFPDHFGIAPAYHGMAGVVGASAGAFGLVAFFAMIYPNQMLTMYLFFFLPLSIRAKSLLIFEALLSIGGMIFPFGGNMAHGAHLGGMLFGAGFVLWQRREKKEKTAKQEVNLRVLPNGNPPKSSATEVPSGPPLSPEYIRKQIDPILDKISAHGMNSLTPEERKLLESASSRIIRR